MLTYADLCMLLLRCVLITNIPPLDPPAALFAVIAPDNLNRILDAPLPHAACELFRCHDVC